MKDINFIPKKAILYFHEQLIQIYGGSTGIRDEKLLDSAIEQPKSTFEGNYLHDNIFKMASAYGFHLCKNHPFLDGNKRIALVAMDTFLQNNGYEITASEKETYKIMIKLSSEGLSKDELTNWLKQNTTSI
ncbi:death-on-curing protein [Orenia metallireducens]|uniref:Death on curing protein n=1 Tax=Orenia metallireducens TaxID=1413210 RepID=A0A285I6J6_9FIRM|nr:type II toxin-antitoxin system death-on-curing family toxin [Orenia metallireducens]PRX23154.1 death-on-curing protein [Orenia metallireducens]SNY42696.1 death on curing protein [Orenia metallireducens]